MIKGRVDIISLGCSKNLVDSERLMARFKKAGFAVFNDAEKVRGEIVVINTCGFIGDAKEESVNTILEVSAMKKRRLVGRVFVMGCLSERYRKELQQEIPEVDGWYGKFDWNGILDCCTEKNSLCGEWERELITPKHYAYLKIAEGCDRSCSYCAIPLIVGKYKSRMLEDVLDEARQLAQKGVRELELIAQDLTYYGLDLTHKNMLPELVEKISEIDGIRWIRLHYAYPTHFPYDLLKVMRENPKVCPYLDVALQHCSNHILGLMRRNIDKQQTIEFVKRLRSEVPEIGLRTTLMVGHPGETEEDFNELVDFVREMRFERMGAFAYSEEEGTYSALHYKNDVSDYEKQRRLSMLMEVQQSISEEVNRARIGTMTDVLIDREEDNWFVGRTGWDSPEVDCEVFVEKAEGIETGEIYKTEITDASEFELFGRIIR